MEFIKYNQEILTYEEIPKKKGEGFHIVKKGCCMYKNLTLSYNAEVVDFALHEPTIQGTEWQGTIIPENIPVTILVDGEEVGTVDTVDGLGSFDFTAEPGTHTIEARAELTEPGRIEVTIE